MKLDFLDKYEYFTGVPDSLLSPLCNYLFDKYGIGDRHIIAANEGNAVGLAAGYHLATGIQRSVSRVVLRDTSA